MPRVAAAKTAPAAPPVAGPVEKTTVVVDVDRFVQTRNALNTAFLGLSSALDKAVKAYIEHTDAVLEGDATLDLGVLIEPFNSLNAAAIEQPTIAQSALEDAPAMADVKKKQQKEKKPIDPNAPKRPITGYLRYAHTERPKVAEAVRRGEREGDPGKLCGADWKALPKEVQQPYIDAYESEYAVWKQKMAAYDIATGKAEKEKEITERLKTAAILAERGYYNDEQDSTTDDSSDEENLENEVHPVISIPAPSAPLRPFSSMPAKEKAKVAAQISKPSPAAKPVTKAAPSKAAAPKAPAPKAAAAPVPTPKSNGKPRFSSIPDPEPKEAESEPAQPSSPVRKRKTPASKTEDADAAPKKRGRKSKATKEAEAAAAATTEPASEPAMPVSTPAPVPTAPVSDKKSKKSKKRKSEVAAE